MKISIISTGSYLPCNLIKNEDFTQFPATALPLIGEKTGILSRYRCSPDESTSTLAIQAAGKCLEKIGFPGDAVDAVVLATSTPDRLIPATATRVANAVGAKKAFAFDVNSVCSGSVFLLEIARGLISAGTAKNVLVVAADTYSKFLNPTDFANFPYFGDGAGAALISSDREGKELLAGVLHSDGSGYETISIKAGGSEIPAASVVNKGDCYFKMNGREVYAFATTKGAEVIEELLLKHSIDRNDVASFVLHQANINILKSISQSLGVEVDRFFSNLQRLGNTAGASVLIALDEYLGCGAEKDGNYVVRASFGGGLSWGASAIKL